MILAPSLGISQLRTTMVTRSRPPHRATRRSLGQRSAEVVLAQSEALTHGRGLPDSQAIAKGGGRPVVSPDIDKRSESVALSPTPYVGELYRTRLFTAEEERDAFRLLASLRRRADELSSESQDSDAAKNSELVAVEADAIAIRNTIIEANLRLVVSVAKRFARNSRLSMSELISEGNEVLIRAVELFDSEYGTRFSTYATTALQRAFMTVLASTYRHDSRFQTSAAEEAFESLAGDAAAPSVAAQRQLARDIKLILRKLNRRERLIVERRFGLTAGTKPTTYRELGESLGLSKERIRQIVVRALEKSREVADLHGISLPDTLNRPAST